VTSGIESLFSEGGIYFRHTNSVLAPKKKLTKF
jgi:hypothetical protein